MRILYLHQYYCPPGGWGNNRSYEFAQVWASLGHSVTVVTSTAYFPAGHPARQTKTHRYAEGGVEVIVLHVPYAQQMSYSSRALVFLKFAWRLLTVSKRLPKPDIIYASSTPPSVGEVGRRLAKSWNIPFVFETVDVWPDVPIGLGIIRNPALRWLLHTGVNRIYKEASAIVALSDGMKEQILSHGIPPSKVWVVPNGTNTELFTPSTTPPKEIIRLVHTGSLGFVNGVDRLIHAAKALEQLDLPAWELVLLGDGAERRRLETLVREIGATRIRFQPAIPKEEMPSFLQQAHIGVMTVAPYPVLEHNSANKWFDYLASGLPIVLNYKGWQAKVLEENEAGLSSPQCLDYTDTLFVQNLAKLVQNPALRTKLGSNGRKLAVTRYKRAILASDLLSYFDDCTHG